LETKQKTLIDGSKLAIEALARAGADVFIGYPITPSNLMYKYAKSRMPYFLAAPDEITTLQWMAGISAAGKVPVTSSAFPGIALMVESINMAYAMELPMVIVITQRLGPSTGSATTGAQGDLLLLNGIISGGYPVPVFSPSDFKDIWELAGKAMHTSVKYRTPVFFLTSKEMIMTQKSFDLDTLKPIEKVKPDTVVTEPFQPYKPEKNLTPAYIPLGNDKYLTRITASTHDREGNIRKAEPEALENSKRLQRKLVENLGDYLTYDWQQNGSDTLIVTWGITTEAVRDAVKSLKQAGKETDVLVVKTLLPVADEIYQIIDRYDKVVFAEENLNGQYREILFGKKNPGKFVSVNKIGSMITPQEVVEAVNS
jgi:2-oxoglutarate ferredoxin oxidoreductase subunit alpha